jgi:hypothetical protein
MVAPEALPGLGRVGRLVGGVGAEPRRAHHHPRRHVPQELRHLEDGLFVHELVSAGLLLRRVARRRVVLLMPVLCSSRRRRRRRIGGTTLMRVLELRGAYVLGGRGRWGRARGDRAGEVEHGVGAAERAGRHVVGGRGHLRHRVRAEPYAPRLAGLPDLRHPLAAPAPYASVECVLPGRPRRRLPRARRGRRRHRRSRDGSCPRRRRPVALLHHRRRGMRRGWARSRSRSRLVVAVAAGCRPGRLHLHRRGRRMGCRRLLLSHEPLGHAHLFGHLLTCAKFSSCSSGVSAPTYLWRVHAHRYIPPSLPSSCQLAIRVLRVCSSCGARGVMRWARGCRGYIRVGKEAGRKRAGRHGEKRHANKHSGGGQTRIRAGMHVCVLACTELVPEKQSARDTSPTKGLFG